MIISITFIGKASVVVENHYNHAPHTTSRMHYVNVSGKRNKTAAR